MFSISRYQRKIQTTSFFCTDQYKTVFIILKKILFLMVFGIGMFGSLQTQAASVCNLIDRPVNAAEREGCCTEVRVWYPVTPEIKGQR